MVRSRGAKLTQSFMASFRRKKRVREVSSEDLHIQAHRKPPKFSTVVKAVLETIRLSSVEQKGRKALVASHRQLSTDLDDLTTTTTNYQRILQELNDTYRQSEGDCPCFRYGDMCAMVERAVSAYEGTPSPAHGTEEDGLVGTGTLNRLKEHSQKFSVLEHALRQQEDRYDVMSEKELHEGVIVLQKEHDRLTDMSDDVSAKLHRLSCQFSAMRSYCCLRRYARVKAMIQEATRDCLREM